jgi:hypothetical protein
LAYVFPKPAMASSQRATSLCEKPMPVADIVPIAVAPPAKSAGAAPGAVAVGGVELNCRLLSQTVPGTARLRSLRTCE